jgi:hypothetical protein
VADDPDEVVGPERDVVDPALVPPLRGDGLEHGGGIRSGQALPDEELQQGALGDGARGEVGLVPLEPVDGCVVVRTTASSHHNIMMLEGSRR